MATRKVLFRGGEREINDTNNYFLAPFTCDAQGALWILRPQYDAWQSTDMLDTLQTIFPSVNACDELPEGIDFAAFDGWFDKVYYAMMERANAKRWFHLIPNAGVFHIDDEQSVRLVSDSKINGASGSEAKRLSDILQAHMDSHTAPSGWFVKTGSTSVKHDFRPNPVFSGPEALAQLLSSRTTCRSLKESRAKCILLRPWEDQISHENELRVFVRNDRVVGVSQQACYNILSIMHMMDGQEIVRACQNLWSNKIVPGLAHAHRFPYECTFDAYFTTDPDDGTLAVHLIEINSEGFGWGPAGASLFHWVHFPPPKSSETPIFIIRVG